MMKGCIDSIESFSTVDGPGIRFTVFLKGCTLRCKYCHNPETWIMTEPNMTSQELINKILKCKDYFGESGGVTFSGGEPLFQSDFLIEVCKILKQHNINIALDTTGIGKYQELLPYIDLIIYDIKDITEKRYHDLTGGDINYTLEFIKYANSLNKQFIIRQVIVPGIHDNINYLYNLSKYIKKYFKSELIQQIEFLPFHQHGKEKYHKLNIKYSYEEMEEMDVNKCNELYQQFISIYQKEIINR